MKKMNAIPEHGALVVNGHKMTSTMLRSKTESAFGVRGSRIFELEIKKDGVLTGRYSRGWTKQIESEDEESTLFLSYLIDKFGKNKPKKKKEMGCLE